MQGKHKQEGNVYIVDSCGTYIVQFQKNQQDISKENFWEDLKKTSLSSEEQAEIKTEISSVEEGEFSYQYDEKDYYACHMPIGPNKWQLVYSASNESINELLMSLYQIDTRNTLLASVCYLVLLFYVGWCFKQTNNEMKKAHQEVQQNMEFMRMSIDHSKHIVFEYDQAGKEIHLKTDNRNQLFRHIDISFVPESLLTRKIISPNSIAELERLFREITTETSSEAEIQLASPQDDIWYRISMNNVYSEDNKIITTVGIVEDISNLKKRESEIQKKLQIQDTLTTNAILYATVDLKTATLLESNGEEVHLSFQ